MKTVLLSIPKSLNSTIEFIRNLVQVILELLLSLVDLFHNSTFPSPSERAALG
jgi:fumarate reductase subunit C